MSYEYSEEDYEDYARYEEDYDAGMYNVEEESPVSVQYKLASQEDGSAVIQVIVSGKGSFSAQSDHPFFEQICEGAIALDESVVELFDLSLQAGTFFERVSPRVTTAYGALFFDGVEVDDSLARQVLRFLEEGNEDFKPLVNFYENVQDNPNEHSRTQLYDWLKDKDFTITPKGFIVAYKGVEENGQGGYQSVSQGTAIVDGEVHKGHIPNYVGAVVEMPRNQVTHDPTESCSSGLHCASYAYAEFWARGAMLEVRVNPRDVVSVPNEGGEDAFPKMRVCRYVVANIIDAPHTLPVADDYEYEEDEEDYLDGYEREDYLAEPNVCMAQDPNGWYCEKDEGHSGHHSAPAYAPDWDDELEPEVERLLEGVKEPYIAYDQGVDVGQVYEDTDKRRAGRTFTVESIDGEHAVGTSRAARFDGVVEERQRKIRLDRLTSRKYKRVN